MFRIIHTGIIAFEFSIAALENDRNLKIKTPEQIFSFQI